jgi:Tfp pilus assembly protein FimT
MPSRPPRAGFTLLELVLMLALLAVVASAGMSWYFDRSSVTLKNAGELLVEDIKIAQQRAAFAADATRISFSNGGYRIANSSGVLIQNPRTALPFEREYDRDAVFRGVSIEQVDFDGGDTSLTFDAQGVPLRGGSILLTFQGDRLAIEVDASGFAKLNVLASDQDLAPALAPRPAQ